jgi:hypothetical protein
MMVTTTCGLCGAVELDTEVDLFEPKTDDEHQTALDIVLTLHGIQAHLDDIAPDGVA